MDLKGFIFPITSGGTIFDQGFFAGEYYNSATHVVKCSQKACTRVGLLLSVRGLNVSNA